MTSVRRQIYLSKVAADRWVVIGGFMVWGKSRKVEGGAVGMNPPSKVTMILTVVSAFKSIRQCSVHVCRSARREIHFMGHHDQK